jgi:hypothetical protein
MYRNDKTLREIGIRFRITREAVCQRIVVPIELRQVH